MRSVGFGIDAGAPYVAVLVELLCFLVAIADRIAYRHDPGAWRSAFTSALAIRVGELFQECFAELLGAAGSDGYKQRFVARCNARMAEYAAYHYTQDGPDFALLRHFGEVLAAEFDRRCAADQAMSVEGPVAAEALATALARLLGSVRT